MTYYVTMTDIFMSGWGKAEGKKNKLVFKCDNYEQACIVAENAENQGNQRYINITTRKPYYSPTHYYVSEKTINDYPSWYQPGYFKKG